MLLLMRESLLFLVLRMCCGSWLPQLLVSWSVFDLPHCGKTACDFEVAFVKYLIFSPEVLFGLLLW